MTASSLTPPPRLRRAPSRAALRRFLRMLAVRGVVGIIVDPVRNGRLRDRGWSGVVRGAVLVSLVLYAALLAATIGAGWLRSHTALTYSNGLTTPRVATVLIVVAVIWCSAMLMSGLLHAAWWARVFALVLVTLLVFGFGFGKQVWSANRAVIYCVVLALAVLVVVVGRRAAAAWEFPVVLGLVAVGVLVPMYLSTKTSRSLGFEIIDTTVAVQVVRLGELAVPAAALAGIAGVQLAVSTADRAVVAARKVPRFALAAVLVLGLARVVITGPRLGRRSEVTGVPLWADALGASVLLALAVLVLFGVLRLAGDRPLPTPDEISDELGGRLGLPVATGVMWTAIPLLVLPSLSVLAASYAMNPGIANWLSDATGIFSRTWVVMTGRLVLAAVLVVLSVRWARAGRVVAAVVSSELVVCLVVIYSGRLTGGHVKVPVSPAMVAEVACFLAVVAVLVLAARRALDPIRLGVLGFVVVVAWAFALGDLLGSPVTTVLGLSGLSLTLYGLVWTFLTGAGEANEESPTYPRESRVLVFMANSVFAIAIVAYVALVRSATTTTVSLSDPAGLGLQILGTALLLGVYALMLRRAFLPRAELEPSTS